jgi:hypothetical protein
MTKIVGMNTPAKTAMKDIGQHIYSSDIIITDENNDTWVVLPIEINTKETRALNRLLGLHTINKFGEKMNHINKRK